MTRTIWTVSAAVLGLVAVVLLQGCATIHADDALVCEALRPALPVKYHANSTDPETVGNIRQANARFTAACP